MELLATVPIIGWAIELDVVESFDSANLQSYNSWNSVGFDLTNLTFRYPADKINSLSEEYHWRLGRFQALISWVIGLNHHHL